MNSLDRPEALTDDVGMYLNNADLYQGAPPELTHGTTHFPDEFWMWAEWNSHHMHDWTTAVWEAWTMCRDRTTDADTVTVNGRLKFTYRVTFEGYWEGGVRATRVHVERI
ncbi:hypothetical protein [Demequina sediminis]|uniref:hypothetical protein n=1 Tax=Demequina sediminis TaxID=1930058 RepID=UPI0025741BD6|nr:hypothetical protein [Demequina sediminis]